MSSLPPGANWAEQEVSASDGNPQAWLGSAVAIAGDIALVGARNTTVDGNVSQGAVYVFRKINGAWQQTQKLTANDGVAGDQFGVAVAMFGELAIITSPFARIDGRTWKGAAYAFSNRSGSWVQVQKIVSNTGAAFDTLGTRVCMDSSWAFIAAGGSNSAGTVLPYRVCVFRYTPTHIGGAWSERPAIAAPNPTDLTSAFGASLALSGSTVLIGARTATLNGVLGQGAAYVYNYGGPNGSWTLVATLVAKDGAARENFGVSVALDKDLAFVGSYGAAVQGNDAQGAVYRFNKVGGKWQPMQKLVAKDGTAISLFGSSMGLSGNRLLIGAYAVGNYTGAAYIFTPKAGTWYQAQKLTASDAVSGDLFGYYSAVSGAIALVGAYGKEVNGNAKQGAAYFFALPPPIPQK